MIPDTFGYMILLRLHNWELLRKVTSLGPNLWLLRKVTSLNLWPFERPQVLAQNCYFCKSHNFWSKLVTFQFKLVDFTKGHKFKVVTFAQSCDLSKLVTFTKGHKFGPKGHKFGPKVVTFTKVTSLDPNLWLFLIIPNFILLNLTFIFLKLNTN